MTSDVWEEVRRVALALPGASERVSRDLRQWIVKDRLFLDRIGSKDLEEVIVEAWLNRAPKSLIEDYLKRGSPHPDQE